MTRVAPAELIDKFDETDERNALVEISLAHPEREV
jgi:hypothetical protein